VFDLEEGYQICIHCDNEFEERGSLHRRGKINECGGCARDVRKSIGILNVQGKTDYCVEVLSSPTVAQVKQVKAAGRHGPGHCHSALGLNSNGASTPKDKIDRVQKSLEKASSSERKKESHRR